MIAHASNRETSNSERLLRSLRLLSVYSSLIVLITGCIVLVSWAVDIEIPKNLPEQISMKPRTALGFIVSGTILGLWHRRHTTQHPQFQRKLTFLINTGSFLVIVLGLLTLIEYYFQMNLEIDKLLFSYSLDGVNAEVKRKIAPNIAINFILSGSALILLARNSLRLAQLLSLFTFFVALLAFIGHLYTVTPFYSAGSLTGMAMNTAICFMLMSLGILFASADQAWMREFSSIKAGGIMARRLIPSLTILPLILGLFILVLYPKLSFTPSSGLAVNSLLDVVVFVVVVWQNAKTLNRMDFERQEIQQRLLQSEQRFRAIVEDQTELISRYQADTTILFVNDAYCRYFGLNSETLIGNSYNPVIYEEDRERILQQVNSMSFENPTVTIENRVVVNGEVRWTQWNNRAIFNSKGELVEYQSVGRDITQLKQIEDELRQLNEQLEEKVQERTAELAATNAILRQEINHRQAVQRELVQQKRLLESFFQSSPVGMVMFNKQLQFMQINEAIAEMNGVSIEATLGHTVDQILPDLAPQLNPIFQQILQTGEPVFNLEIAGETPKHPRVTCYWQISYFPLLRQDHQIIGLGGVIVEISDRKRTEIALRESEERFRRAVVDAPFPIILHAEDGKIIQISNTVREITGYTTDEISTIEDWTERVYGERQNVVLEGINRLYQLNHRVEEGEYEIRTKEGNRRIWNFSSAPLGQLSDHRRLVISMAADITERKQAEVALATRLRQQAIITQLGQMALSGWKLNALFDQTTAFVAESFAVEYCKVLELLPDGQTLLLRSGVGWRGGLVGEATVGTDENSQAGYTLRVHEPVVVEDLRTDTRFNGPALLQEHHVISGMSTIIAGRNRHQPFGILGVHSTQQRQFTQDDVNFLQVIANLLAEVIARKQNEDEIQQLNATLEQRVQERTQQLEDANHEMEAFAYSVAHDLRAPLRAIQGFSQVLIEDYGNQLDQLAQEYINRMSASAEHLDQLILDLLSYSGLNRTEIQLETISLTAIVERVVNELNLELDTKQAEILIESSLPIVKAQRSILKQVIINLVSNAIKFVEPGETPRISIWGEEGLVNQFETETQWVRLWIEDNGIGISPQHQDRIFQAFERLHGIEAYPGTGIGLAIVKRGVERMGGRVGVESDLGQGSRFWIELMGAESVNTSKRNLT